MFPRVAILNFNSPTASAIGNPARASPSVLPLLGTLSSTLRKTKAPSSDARRNGAYDDVHHLAAPAIHFCKHTRACTRAPLRVRRNTLTCAAHSQSAPGAVLVNKFWCSLEIWPSRNQRRPLRCYGKQVAQAQVRFVGTAYCFASFSAVGAREALGSLWGRPVCARVSSMPLRSASAIDLLTTAGPMVEEI